MSPGLRLSLLLLIAGCAEQALVVPDSDWRTVPAAQRDKVDRQHEADLAGARAELAAAQASLAAFQEAPPMQRPARPPPTATPDPNDVYNTVARDHEKARSEAFGRVEAAIVEVQIDDLSWRRLRVDTAQARVAMVISQRELTRAQTIDRNLPGTDTYDVAPLRGQFSRAQQRWYKLSTAADDARDAFERASTSLASAKEAYAQLMRSGPLRLEDSIAADHSARLELTGWMITRSDIRRRRGLRHFLDDAGASPQLRKLTVKLSPAPRVAPSASAPPPPEAPRVTGSPAPPPADRRTGPAPAPADRSTGAPPADRRAGAPPAAAAHPADRAGAPTPATVLPGARPAARPAAPAAPGADHPADRASSPASPPASSARRTSEAPRGAPSSVPKEERSAGAASAKPVERPMSEASTHAR